MTTDRRGFTLVELIVVTVLGALLIGATLEVLITNQKTYTAQNAQIMGQQATRAVLGVLMAELREVSPEGGDLVAMASDTLRIRVARRLGLICNDTARGVRTFRAIKVGDWILDEDSVHVFADNDGTSMSDDNWLTTRVTDTDTTTTCGTNFDAQYLTFADPGTPDFTTDSVSSGAEVRVFEHYTYGLMTRSGVSYLGRRASGGNWTPLAGPLRSDGLRFRYLDSLGAVTNNGLLVEQIEITVLTESEARGPDGAPVSDSVTVRVYTRN